MSKVAFLGLGAMGSRMAANLLKAGRTVTVWNRSPAAAEALVASGARKASSPKEAAKGADFVFAIVRDDDASQNVWLDSTNGALAGMHPGAVAIESSTLTPEWIRELSEHFSAKGISLLDAPVSGSIVERSRKSERGRRPLGTGQAGVGDAYDLVAIGQRAQRRYMGASRPTPAWLQSNDTNSEALFCHCVPPWCRRSVSTAVS
jgi:hypothetical protein